jgi:hypothetical protein
MSGITTFLSLNHTVAVMRMRHTIVLFLCLVACGSQAAQSTNASEALEVSISIPAEGNFGSSQESRRLSFSALEATIHVLISNNSTNEIRLWKEDCSWGYEALSFQITDGEGNHWAAVKKPRAWRGNYPRWWLLKPKETLTIPVDFGNSTVWDGFKRPPKDSKLRLTLIASFGIAANSESGIYQIWNGRIVSAPVEVIFNN